MCEDCEEYPNIRELLRQYTKEWIERTKAYFYKKYCVVKGHKFKKEKLMSILYKDHEIALERCKCGLSQYVYSFTGKVLSEEEASSYSGMLLWEYLNTSSNMWEILPKEPWSGSNES